MATADPAYTVVAPRKADAAPVECRCLCHVGQCLHFRPCCLGRCVSCGRWFRAGLVAHVLACRSEGVS